VKPGKSVKTQARSLASKQAVIDAVIQLISNHGFSSATTANIAKQAGVSWGVLQYHFGGKREIFQAVLGSANPALFKEIDDIPFESGDPEQLITSAIDKLWQYNSSPTFRAAMEILLNHAHLGDDFYEFALGTYKELTKFFRKLFKACGSKLTRSEEEALANFVISTLRGMAVHNAMFPQHELAFRTQRKILSETVLARLHPA
jgi:AcrR family transcriptional regulator